MLEKETAKLEDSLTAMVRITKENEEIDKSREIYNKLLTYEIIEITTQGWIELDIQERLYNEF